ncbi:MAG TPA: ATP-dependent sacrificial sulfur transferase LarE [Desulfomonilaceae bacterium]|nr:ATP-dependent sacrificial sulfur transferase LarE [Desulfomonilaceae bacterium]
MDSGDLDVKYAVLRNILKNLDRVVVAYSGGVDSTFLVWVAKDVLGDRVLAATAFSATAAIHERENALQLARKLGAKHIVIHSGEMDLPEFTKNPPDRCYICKKHRFGMLTNLASEQGYSFVLDGENADDAGDYRPGSLASRELGVRSPLKEAELSKEDIRRLSKRFNLPTWNKPSYACLASRIPYHRTITPENLAQVDAAEDFIRSMVPEIQIRVRHHGDIALIEVQPDFIADLVHSYRRKRIVKRFTELGFSFVAVDLEGYTMGSLNRALDT